MNTSKLVLSAIFSLSAIYTSAQPGLTRFDVNTGTAPSFPLHITQFGTKIAFYANNGTKGWELHTTDGSTAPVIVNDINPLGGNAISQYYVNPIAQLGSKLYFTADNGISGTELFSYSGSGTPLMTPEIESGTDGSAPDNFVTLNNKLYFRARTTTEGYELWCYDPNLNQHTRLTDINAGADSSITGNIIAYNNNIYFTADSGLGNNELWIYNILGSTASMVMDINPGNAPSNPQNFTIINGKLYFTAEDVAFGRELYVVDGNNPPARLTDIVAGGLSSLPDVPKPIIAQLGTKIYFSGMNSATEKQLYSYDPATGNAVVAASVNGTNTSEPEWITNYGGKIYFTAYNDTIGVELWAYDGSSAPSLVFNLCAGALSSNPQQLLPVGDDLYFRAIDCNVSGEEMLKFNYKKVSVANVSFKGAATVFPNPAKNTAYLQLQLQQPETLLITITDMHGRAVYASGFKQYAATNHSIALPLNGIATGNYIYNIYSAAGSRYYSSKLVVE